MALFIVGLLLAREAAAVLCRNMTISTLRQRARSAGVFCLAQRKHTPYRTPNPVIFSYVACRAYVQ